jgi:hypothetical protein
MRAEEVRLTLKHLIHQQPFEKFLINLENGDRYLIEHPENVAFDPNENGRMRFSVVTRDLFCYATFESVSSIVHQDIGTTVGA